MHNHVHGEEAQPTTVEEVVKVTKPTTLEEAQPAIEEGPQPSATTMNNGGDGAAKLKQVV